MDTTLLLKAVADETRMKIITLLLKHSYCVRALAGKLKLTEATISQHLKVLREAGLLVGEKRGYFMHYDVEREVLCELAKELEKLAATKREACDQENGGCRETEHKKCRVKGKCTEEAKELCHGERGGQEDCRHCHGTKD